MKNILIIFAFLLTFLQVDILFGQPPVVTGTSEVCVDNNSEQYIFTGANNGTFSWSVPGGHGTILSGQTSDTVEVDWHTGGTATLRVEYGGASPFDYTVNVYALSNGGTISGDSEHCLNAIGSLTLGSYTGTIQRWERIQEPYQSGDPWTDLGNAGQESLQLDDQLPQGKYSYRVWVKNGECNTDVSDEFTLDIYSASQGGILSVSGGTLINNIPTICDNGNVDLILNSSLGAIQEWQWSTNGINFSKYNVITDHSLTSQTVTIDQDVHFKVIVKNGICGSEESNVVTINHDPLPEQGTITGGGTFCFTASGTITLSNFTGTVDKWEYTDDDGSTWPDLEDSNGDAITSTSFNYSAVTKPTTYRVWIKSGEVCSSIYQDVLVYVHPDDAGDLSGTDVLSCDVDANVDITYTSPGSLGGTHEWQFSENGGPWGPMATQPVADHLVTSVAVTTAYRVEYTAPGCSPRTTDPVTFTVVDIPTGAGGTLNSLSVCAGADFNIELTGNAATLTSWEIQEYIPGQTPDWDPISDPDLTDNILPFTNFSGYTSDIKANLDYQGCAVESQIGAITFVANNTVLKEIKGGRKVLQNDNEGLITYKNSNDVIQYWEKSEDGGTTWNTVSNQNTSALNYTDLIVDTDFRVTVQDGIGCNVLTSPFVSIDVIDPSLNTVETKAFSVDENGTEKLIGHSKAYFDYAGKALQSQSLNLAANQVLASQTIEDDYGRPVLSTLPAPINNTEFEYRQDFVTTASGEVYDNTHFDGTKKDSPDPVGNSAVGTLGWYYGDNNTMEPFVATTSYPYSRTDYYEDGTGEVKRAASPGDQMRMGQGHEVITKTLPVGDNELKHYLALRQLILGSESGNELEQIYKQVSIDANGQESVVYVGESGDPIASAIIKGDNTLPLAIDRAGDELEFHIPAGNGDITVNITGATAKEIYNKLSESPTPVASLTSTQNSVILSPGIYKMTGGDNVSYNVNYSDLAYNFYDNSGRLAASIAPNGLVNVLANTNPPASVSELTYMTRNTYDFRGRLIQTDEPDAGITNYIYRKDGSIRFSQNAQQAAEGKYSYTSYDNSGRPVESGEYNGTGTMDFNSTAMLDALENTGRGEFTTSERADSVETYYDLPATSLPTELASYTQEYTHGAVAYTQNEEVTTWYSYDEFGRVTWFAMQYHNMDERVFILEYEYDFTGNVLTVAYQKQYPGEAFYHHYTYDEENRLITASTSVDGNVDDAYLHATYSYYLHGPLKRVEYATDLQGIDYVYTVQGQLKSINNPNNINDPGQDGTSNPFTKDVFGMSFEYYNGDYTRANTNVSSVILDETAFSSQYGGNIRATAWGRDLLMIPRKYAIDTVLQSYDPNRTVVIAGNSISLEPGFQSNGHFEAYIDPDATYIPSNETPNLQAYTYDDKYQLKSAVYGKEGSFSNTSNENAVRNLSYDANGNILTLDRYDDQSALVDVFNYQYEPNKNQLNSVSNYVTDYDYNQIGQMTAVKGRSEMSDQYMKYDVTGKVVGIYSDADYNTAAFTYKYDDRGFRIMKRDEVNDKETWYVRDASGNLISIYEKDNGVTEQTELPIYAASKIGTAFRNPSRYKYNYEITDHLGNVRVVVSKLKFMETATMEPEYAANEESIFANVSETRQLDQLYNTTYNGDHASRLNGAQSRIVGPALSLEVSKDDVVKMNVNARYMGSVADQGLISGLFTVLSTAFELSAGGETSQAHTAVQDAIGSLAAVPGHTGDVPKAYIQYLLFDKDYNYIQPPQGQDSYKKITNAANGAHENLYLEVDIEQDGYIYIYVVNESQYDINVFFDDLTVTQLGVDITQTTDYYPFGSVMNHWEKEDYRFGYQGEYAEEDDETGFSHFELRDYDPAIGRWMNIDPYRQYASPYVGMGNNPVYLRDSDGGCADPDGKCNFFQRAWYRISGQSEIVDFYDQYQTNKDFLQVAINTDNLKAIYGEDSDGNQVFWMWSEAELDWDAIQEMVDPYLPNPIPFPFVVPDGFLGEPIMAFSGKVRKGWIKTSIYKSLSKINQKAFKHAMQKGVTTRGSGIHPLTATEIATYGKGFTHKLWIKGKGSSHFRILGNQSSNGHWYFEKIINNKL